MHNNVYCLCSIAFYVENNIVSDFINQITDSSVQINRSLIATLLHGFLCVCVLFCLFVCLFFSSLPPNQGIDLEMSYVNFTEIKNFRQTLRTKFGNNTLNTAIGGYSVNIFNVLKFCKHQNYVIFTKTVFTF